MKLNEIFELVKDVPDFPKPGILFRDITPVLAHPIAFKALTLELAKLVPSTVTKIVAIESRGFLLGSALAQHLGLGLILVRKPGKLPRPTVSQTYSLEYGEDQLQIHKDDLKPGEKVVILDDVLATGGTASATEKLCENLGAEVSAAVFMMEIGFLAGRKKLKAKAEALYQV